MCDAVDLSDYPDYGQIRERGTEPSIPNSLSFTSAKRSTFLLSWSREVNGSRLRITIETALCRASDGETGIYPDERVSRRAILDELDSKTFLPLSRTARRTLGGDLRDVLSLSGKHNGSPYSIATSEDQTKKLDHRCTVITKAFGSILLFNMGQAVGGIRLQYPSVFYVSPDQWGEMTKAGTDQINSITQNGKSRPVNKTSMKHLDLAMQEGIGSMPLLEGSEIYLRQEDGSQILIAGNNTSGEGFPSLRDPFGVDGTAAQGSEEEGSEAPDGDEDYLATDVEGGPRLSSDFDSEAEAGHGILPGLTMDEIIELEAVTYV